MTSMTKYMIGHSDVVMGYAVTNNKKLYEDLSFIHKSLGACPGILDCYLALRSAKTLHVRME
jgi:cystathionine beta-lyase/cystathionine gamma-synthase